MKGAIGFFRKQFFSGQAVGQKNIDPTSTKSGEDCRNFSDSSRDPNDPLGLLKIVQFNSYDPVHERRLYYLALMVKETQADVSHGSLITQFFSFGRRKDVPTIAEQFRGLHGADTHKGEIDRVEQTRSLKDRRIARENSSCFRCSYDPGGLEQDGRRANTFREFLSELGCVILSLSFTDASEDLNDFTAAPVVVLV